MGVNILVLPILVPLAAGVAAFAMPNRWRGAREAAALIGASANLALAIRLFKTEAVFSLSWLAPGMEMALRIYSFSAFIILAASFFGLLITLYSTAFMYGKAHSRQFYLYLLVSLGLANGAVLSENLVALLFFWEALLLTLFGMISIGRKGAFRTAAKAFIIVGLSDLCLMAGIAISGRLAGTLAISGISLTIGGLGGVAFLFLVAGAISKAGSMPFHSWIPDAALDAPLPFMAIFPGALEKLVGIYFLARVALDMFRIESNSWAGTLLMAVGSLTILSAVMMALIQKDYKRLLSYHAISQVGYMILGIGTLLPAGIVGGIFHMINNALYKSGLFLTAGAVEREAGTTDLERLGGLKTAMPATFACFLIMAASISGVPPFNGFFSKELIYDGALARGRIFYLAALAGSFLTAASFLKLGHAAFLGKGSKAAASVKDPPSAMMIPMVTIALVCIIFGVWNTLPLKGLIEPAVGLERLEGHEISGMPSSMLLVALTMMVLIGALLNHLYGVRRTGSGLKAADHIHYAPILSNIYSEAEKGRFDPYNIGRVAVRIVSRIAWYLDRAVDFFTGALPAGAGRLSGTAIRRLHNGSHKTYLIWSVAGLLLVLYFMVRG